MTSCIRRRAAARRFFTLLLLIASHAVWAEQQVERHTFDVGDARRSFYLFVPASATPGSPAPLVIVLHGSGSDGRSIVRRWSDLAQAQGFIVAGPNARDRRAWQLRTDGPSFIHALVEAIALGHAIDRRRIYLFGHSGGAVYALTLSMLESEYFAAVAVHAGAWRTQRELDVVRVARRKIPVAIFVGDRDVFFPLPQVRRTRAALESAAHRVSLEVIAGHTHDYGRVAARVNRAAWAFLQPVRLDSQPRLRSYD